MTKLIKSHKAATTKTTKATVNPADVILAKRISALTGKAADHKDLLLQFATVSATANGKAADLAGKSVKVLGLGNNKWGGAFATVTADNRHTRYINPALLTAVKRMSDEEIVRYDAERTAAWEAEITVPVMIVEEREKSIAFRLDGYNVLLFAPRSQVSGVEMGDGNSGLMTVRRHVIARRLGERVAAEYDAWRV